MNGQARRKNRRTGARQAAFAFACRLPRVAGARRRRCARSRSARCVRARAHRGGAGACGGTGPLGRGAIRARRR